MVVYELSQYMSCPREIRQINALALGVDLLKIPLPLRGRGIIRINTQRACINLSNSLVTRYTHLQGVPEKILCLVKTCVKIEFDHFRIC